MGTEHTKAHDHHPDSEIERSERVVTFISVGDPNPEIKLDVRDEFTAKTLEHKSSFVSVARTASTKFKKVSHRVKNLAALHRRPPAPFDRSKSVVNALKGLTFISKKEGWDEMEKKFNKLKDETNGTLHRSQFCECIGMKEDSKEFAEKLFETFAKKQSIDGDSITKDQLKIFWEQINDQRDRLRTFFDMIDKDSDGKITEAEVTEIISLTASTNKLPNVEKRAKEYAALIMRELDQDNLGYIMIDTLEMLLLQPPSPSSSSKSLSRVLSESKGETRPKPLASRAWESGKYFVVDNWRRIWVMALWIAAMSGLFAYKYCKYRKSAAYKVMGECVCTAKGAAETLKLNMALILLPVCRNTITWLRNNTNLASLVPFDDNLNFHQMIAIGIAVGTIIHTLAHMSCDFPRLIHASSDKYRPMEPFFGHPQQKSYLHFVWSVEGVTGIVMIVLMAIAFTLAAPCFRTGKPKKEYNLRNKLTGFNAFWYSHHLFVIVYALLIVHGLYLYLIHDWYRKTTWMYLAVPITLYGIERMIRALRSSIEAVTIIKASIYPGNVVALKMSKPEGFTYRSGQYMFVKCKAVSPFEWHPFSITSSPSDDYLSVHIRVLGDWTAQLKTIFSQAHLQQPDGKSGVLRTDCLLRENNPNNDYSYPRVWIDGPYGAPAQECKQYEVLLLVGLGIGATPMISIVKDIVNNMKAMESKKHQPEGFNTRKVYFYWSTREQGSFEWFENVMNEVALLDNNDVIEMHNYCTSVHEEGDARSVLIAMLQAINHAKNGLDIVSGTRVKSHFGRPNWRNVYDGIAKNHPKTEVGVFYCGAPTLVKDLKHLALEFSHKTTTKFDFHKENF